MIGIEEQKVLAFAFSEYMGLPFDTNEQLKRREAARALVDFWALNSCWSLPEGVVVKKALAIYKANHEWDIIDASDVRAMMFDMLHAKGRLKMLRRGDKADHVELYYGNVKEKS